MILAQNRQQLLSGNKLIVFLVIPILLVSCGAFKKIIKIDWPEDEEIVVVNPDKGKVTVLDTPKEDKEKKEEKAYSFVNFKGERFRVPVHKQSFNIVVLLPFHSASPKSTKEERRSNLMLEYYQGMKLAIREIEELNSKFVIHYFDTNNDTLQLQNLLKKPVVENADLIIGPTDEAQLRIAAFFARKRKIPLFSPITNDLKLWSENPYIFSLNPSSEMMAKAFVEYFNNYHNKEQLIVVRDGKRFDRTFGTALVAELAKSKINHSVISHDRGLKWEDHFNAEKVLVLSTVQDKNELIYTINGLLNESKRASLIGSDKWLEFSSVDYNHWERLNFRFISTNLAQVPNEKAIDLKRSYRYEYNNDPSWFTFKGYDHLLFACETLDAFGKYFPLFLEDKTISYSNSNFCITKEGNSFDNKYIQILEFKERKIVPVYQIN